MTCCCPSAAGMILTHHLIQFRVYRQQLVNCLAKRLANLLKFLLIQAVVAIANITGSVCQYLLIRRYVWLMNPSHACVFVMLFNIRSPLTISCVSVPTARRSLHHIRRFSVSCLFTFHSPHKIFQFEGVNGRSLLDKKISNLQTRFLCVSLLKTPKS